MDGWDIRLMKGAKSRLTEKPASFAQYDCAGGFGRSTGSKRFRILEARVGFEPTDGGFADLSLRPLGYRAGSKKYSEIAKELSGANKTRKFRRRPQTFC